MAASVCEARHATVGTRKQAGIEMCLGAEASGPTTLTGDGDGVSARARRSSRLPAGRGQAETKNMGLLNTCGRLYDAGHALATPLTARQSGQAFSRIVT